MNCGYGEKLVLYFYGEADAGMRADFESHLLSCASCRGEIAALESAGRWLDSVSGEPSGAVLDAVLTGAGAPAAGRSGFFFRWGDALLAGAMAGVMAGIFAFSGLQPRADLAWNSGLDQGLDSVEYSLYQAQSGASQQSADWDYGYSALEDEVANCGQTLG